MVVSSPGGDGAVFFEAQTVLPSAGDGDKIGIGQRDIALAPVVVSPGGDGAIFFQAQTVPISGGDGDEIDIGRRDIALALAVASPGGDGAVFFQAQTVGPSGGDGDKAPVQLDTDYLAAPADNPACLLRRTGRLGDENTHNSAAQPHKH